MIEGENDAAVAEAGGREMDDEIDMKLERHHVDAADLASRGEHQVHVLDGGARSALAEIVEQRHQIDLRSP